MGPAFVEMLPVGKFHGIGPATSAKMNALGIFTGMDMRNQTIEFMNAHFGKAGAYYYWISRGVDERLVRADRIRKSVGRRTHLPVIFPNSTPWWLSLNRSSTRFLEKETQHFLRCVRPLWIRV
jgi:nucleotidyltransferase/DNA polymerase involved in DNA repair